MQAAVDLVQPWRKSFPICRPPTPFDTEDAKRFAVEFPEGCDSIDAGDGYTLGDVVRGTHEGGLAAGAPVIGGTAATIARKTRDRDKRRKLLAATLLRYIQSDTLKEQLRAAGNGEQMWREYTRVERIGIVSESQAEDMKEAIRGLTILGTVGFTERSVQSFSAHIGADNNKIYPAASRFSEHDLARIVLKALIGTGQLTVANEALTEYNCAPASRRFLQATYFKSIHMKFKCSQSLLCSAKVLGYFISLMNLIFINCQVLSNIKK